MKKIAFLFLILCFQNLSSQNIIDKLEQVTTVEEAEKFAIENPDLLPEILGISPELDSSIPAYYKSLYAGYVLNENGNTIKVISVAKVKAFHVNYIYLDGSKLSVSDIKKLRTEIINEYKKGTPFSDLAKKYTMDGNVTGDLNWTEGMMVPNFETAINSHKKDEIFTIDIPENNWYYVTLKTSEEREVTKITMLKIKSGS